MAYDTSNPPRKVLDLGFASGGSMWLYESTHGSTEIVAAGFFEGAGVGGPGGVGMAVNDLLINVNTGTDGVSWHRVSSLSTSTGWQSRIDATVSAGST